MESLLSKMDSCMRVRERSPKTRQSYLSHVERFAKYGGRVRIRHFGLLAPSGVATKLAVARGLLTQRAEQPVLPSSSSSELRPAADSDAPDYVRLYRDLTGIDLLLCPNCGADAMHARPLDLRGRDPP